MIQKDEGTTKPTCAYEIKSLIKNGCTYHTEGSICLSPARFNTLCSFYPIKSPETLMNFMVNHPPHYTSGKVECIDALESAITSLVGIEAVCTANAIKYLWRWKQKNGVEDLKKAKWYIDKLIERSNT